MLHGLDPDDRTWPKRLESAAIIDAQARSAALIEAANRHLDNLATILNDPVYVILLADADGIVIAVRTSNPRDCWSRPSDQWIGTDLSERSEGTNATGTALVEQRPVKIEDGEHFLARNVNLLCDGAPIYGSDGAVIGSIDVSRDIRAENPTLSALIMFAVIETARRIELTGFHRAFPDARLTLALPSSAGGTSAMVAIDIDDNVVGATHAARSLLGLSDTRMETPFPAEQIMPSAPETGDGDGELAAAERRAILRMLAKHGDNVSAAAKALGISRGTLHRKLSSWRR